MRRREFITLLGGAAAWPLAASAQPGRMRGIGVLTTLDARDPEVKRWLGIFQEELDRLGWQQGRNIWIEYRLPGSDPVRLQTDAADLVAMNPDVLFAAATPALVALSRQTRSLPIVFNQVSDPVKLGLVASLARPGGNATGFANGSSCSETPPRAGAGYWLFSIPPIHRKRPTCRRSRLRPLHSACN